MNATKSKASKSPATGIDALTQEEKDNLLAILLEQPGDSVNAGQLLMPRQMRGMVQSAAYEAVRNTLGQLKILFDQIQACKADPAFFQVSQDLEHATNLLDSIVLLERYERENAVMDRYQQATWATVLLHTAQEAEALGVSWAQIPPVRPMAA